MKPATIRRLEQFTGDGRDFNGSYSAWLNNRRFAIRDARSEGHTLAEIAGVLGVSRQRVQQILAAPNTHKEPRTP